jgi:ankyrin repeat protein
MKTKLPFLLLIPLFAIACSSSQKKKFATPSDDLVDAAERGDDKRVAELIAQGTGINKKSGTGYTALMGAAERGQLNVVNQLLAANADVNALNSFSWNALMLAAVGERHGSTSSP